MKSWRDGLLLIVLLSAFSTEALAEDQIRILSAAWSGKDVTAEAAKFCAGKTICEYKVNPAFIGEAAQPANKSFFIRWRCDAPNEFYYQFPHDATGEFFRIKCNPWTYRSPLKYPNSFHSLIMSNQFFQKKFNPECVTAIHHHLQKWDHFESPTLRRFTTQLKDFPIAEASDLEFFHYTKSTDVEQIAKNRAYDRLFSYARIREAKFQKYTYDDLYFYVSADARSTAPFGPIQMKVYFAPDTLILYPTGDGPGGGVASESVFNSIQDELIARNPELGSCREKQVFPYEKNILMILAAEAEMIGLIAYYGINNVHNKNASGVQWMEVLGPWAIKDMVRGN